MGRWASILTSVKATVGASTDTEAKAWIVDAARRLNADAEFLTAPVELGPTVNGQATYELGSAIDLAALRVGTDRYVKATPDELWDLEAGTATVEGTARFFVPDWDADGAPLVRLYPVPVQAGLSVQGRMVIPVADPDWVDGDPPTPEDFDRAITHGAISIGLSEKDEDLEAAQWHEDRFTAAVSKLKRRKFSRVGSGPVRIRVAGRDF